MSLVREGKIFGTIFQSVYDVLNLLCILPCAAEMRYLHFSLHYCCLHRLTYMKTWDEESNGGVVQNAGYDICAEHCSILIVVKG